MKLALVYDRINKFGGAERVLQALHEIWPQAPLFTSLYHPKKAPWATGWDIRPSFLNKFPLLQDKHEWLAPLMPYVFESFDFSSFDVVISITSAEAKGILTTPHQLHLCYLLTPTRYFWSKTHEYINTPFKKFLMLPSISSLRRWDFAAAARPDYLIPISQAVAKRCVKYYRREPEPVIYPPVDVKTFAHHPPRCATTLRDYYLIVSRPVSYKHTQFVIDTFTQMPEKTLIIIGAHKRGMLHKNIISVGQITDRELICYYHHARAFIFPQEEDFGITAVEAQAAGVPVIAYKGGGATETVIENRTGVFFRSRTITDLIEAIKRCEQSTWYDKLIRENSLRFDKQQFQPAIQATVEELWTRHQKLR